MIIEKPDPQAFKSRSREAVQDPLLRRNIREAMDFLVDRRASQFPDQAEFERLRAIGESIRKDSLRRLPQLLEKLEARLQELGVSVHYAETPAEANALFRSIARRHQARCMVKGKSMVSEEIELNHEMEKVGVSCIETDMGEYILQLAGDRPSHIIMPAIHKTKEDIAKIFAGKIPDTAYTDDVDELISIGRRELRTHFRDAPIGVTGANFLVAETGTIVLVENEGNGRMCTSIPEVHIAITGIEKVVDRLDSIAPLFKLLTRSATGQAVTTYLNLVTGPRRPGERDGPREMHLILLDNGRTQAYRDDRFRATLQCIRCGACMNHCPVYTRVGGLSYGTTYPGPIGSIISPHLLGLESTKHLPTASSLCGACGDVCPVGIPIPKLLLSLRQASQNTLPPSSQPLIGQGSGRSIPEVLAWKIWRLLYANPQLYALFTWCATRMRWLTPSYQGGWTRARAPLRPARRSLRELISQQEGKAMRKP
ncbi:iron-sulfur cluster-binding protein [Solimonas sp. K1W22B-7]|uniref:LutB/LldF family L-lactate oxidation iron-sulfur protein n=1 Tax=Solimonas sp. K1W22B-7 TaxID=2303331 RepID=UPI000E330355|nr:LutB/LldF family L-lactate oxidation iron-sulfur protein [Solimonas sp. K1W22B-7]AXQ31280.1 iron-sulfur cluster-binding protein [Solimonas sp. K1W22B-7]